MEETMTTQAIKLMDLPTAKRSFLMQLEGSERLKQEVFGSDPATLPQERVDELYDECRTRWRNLELTEDRIDALEYAAAEEAEDAAEEDEIA